MTNIAEAQRPYTYIRPYVQLRSGKKTFLKFPEIACLITFSYYMGAFLRIFPLSFSYSINGRQEAFQWDEKRKKMYPSLPPTAFFFVLIYSQCSLGNARKGISQTFNLKTFRETCAQTPYFGVRSALQLFFLCVHLQNLSLCPFMPRNRFSEDDPKVPKIVYNSLLI